MLLGSASLEALGVEALARAGMTARSATFTTTHGVIDRVHDNAAVAGTATEPARAAGLAGAFERVLTVADNTDSSLAGGKDFAGFAGR